MAKRYNMNTLQLQRRGNIKWARSQVPVFEEQRDYVLCLVGSAWALHRQWKSLVANWKENLEDGTGHWKGYCVYDDDCIKFFVD